MILCSEPWYNEPGREMRLDQARSLSYNRDIWKHTVTTAIISWMTDRLSQPGKEESPAKGKNVDTGKSPVGTSVNTSKAPVGQGVGTSKARTRITGGSPWKQQLSPDLLKKIAFLESKHTTPAPVTPTPKSPVMPDVSTFSPSFKDFLNSHSVNKILPKPAPGWVATSLFPDAAHPQGPSGNTHKSDATQIPIGPVTDVFPTPPNSAPGTGSSSDGFVQVMAFHPLGSDQTAPSPWGIFSKLPNNFNETPPPFPALSTDHQAPPQPLSLPVAYPPGLQPPSVSQSLPTFADDDFDDFMYETSDYMGTASWPHISEAMEGFSGFYPGPPYAPPPGPPKPLGNTLVDGKDDAIWGDVIRHHFERKGHLILSKAKKSSYQTDKMTLKLLGDTLRKMGFIE